MQSLAGLDEDGNAVEGLTSSMQKYFDTATKGKVTLVDENGQLKSTYDIMSQLSQSWATMSNNQKNYLAQSVAGKRNAKSMIALLDNWDTVTKSVATGLDSAGSAANENAVYMDSIEGRVNQLKSSFESFANTTIDSDLIKGLVSFATALLDVADKAGGLTPIILALVGAIVIFKREAIATLIITKGKALLSTLSFIGSVLGGLISPIKNLITNIGLSAAGIQTYATATNTASLATITLQTALQGVLGVLGLVTMAVTIGVQIYQKHQKELEETRKRSIEAGQAIQTQADSLAKLYTQYNAYVSMENRTTVQESKYVSVQEEICQKLQNRIDKLKGLTVGTSDYKKALATVTKEDIAQAFKLDLTENTAEMDNSVKAAREEFENKFNSNTKYSISFINALSEDDVSRYNDCVNLYKELNEQYAILKNNGDDELAQNILNSKMYIELKEKIDESAESYKTYIDLLSSQTVNNVLSQSDFKMPTTIDGIEELRSKFEAELKAQDGVVEGSIQAILDTIETKMSGYYADIIEMEKETNSLTEDGLKTFRDNVSETVSTISTLSKAWEEQNKNGELSADTIIKLNELGYASCLVYDQTTKKVNINAQAYKDLAKAKMKDNLESANNNYEKAIEGLKGEAESLGLVVDNYKNVTDYIEAYKKALGDKIDNDVLYQTYLSASNLLDVMSSLNDNIEENIFGSMVDNMKDVNSTIKTLTSSIGSLSSAVAEQNENGSLSINTVLDLIDNGYAAALSYDKETGAIRLNTEACKALIEVKLQAKIAEAEMQRNEAIKKIQEETNATKAQTEAYLDNAKAKLAAGTADKFTMQVKDVNSTTKSKTNTMTEAEKNRKFLDSRPASMDDDQWERYKKEHGWDSYKDMEAEANVKQTVEQEVDVTETVKTVIDTDAYIDSLKSLLKNIDSWFGTNGSTSNPSGETEAERLERENTYTAKTWREAYEQLYNANRMTLDQYTAEMENLLRDSQYDIFRSMTSGELAQAITSSDEAYANLAQDYIDLTGEINSLKLDKLTEQFNDLKKVIDETDTAISNLGEIDTAEDRTKQASYLSAKYKQVIAGIAQAQTTLNSLSEQDLNYTEKKAELEKQLNELIQDRVSIEDDVKSLVKETIELQKQNKLQAEQNKAKAELLAIEKKLFGNEGKSEYEHVLKEQQKVIKDQIDALQKEHDAIEKQNEEEKIKTELLQLQLDLQNALNNKTTKVLTKQDDGSWQFEYTYDAEKVKDIQQQLEDKQKEYDEFNYSAEIDKLQTQYDALQEDYDKKNDQYEDAQYHINKQEQLAEAQINSQYANIDKLVEDALGNFDSSVESLAEVLTKWTQALNEANKTSTDLAQQEADIELSSKNNSENTQEALNTANNNLATFNAQMETNVSGIKDGMGEIVSATRDILGKLEKGYDFSSIDLSTIINAQSINSSNAINKLTDLLNEKSISGLGQTFNISSISFPNATNSEEIKNAILSLPTVAIQHASKER